MNEEATATRYGAVTFDRWMALAREGIHLHVFYRGQDVTTRCAFADDTNEGKAELYLKNAAGQSYIDPNTGAVANEIVVGVTIREGEPLILRVQVHEGAR